VTAKIEYRTANYYDISINSCT